LIIGRNPKNLFATKENLFELVSEKQGGADDIEAKELFVASHIMLWLVEILFISK
jgi:hypothetical protein